MFSWSYSHAGISCNIHDTDIDELLLFIPEWRTDEVNWTLKWWKGIWKSKMRKKTCQIGRLSNRKALAYQKLISK